MNLTESTSAFGLRLLERLLAEQGAGNVMVSPFSATLALSMAATAARGETRASILKALGLDPAVDPSAQARQTIERLMQSDGSAQVELADAVWAQQGLPLNPAYVTKLRDDYKAQLANLDFTSPDAPAVVNRWVDAATHHKISKLVDKFQDGTVAYLVNAAYFHALWATVFQPDNGSNTFHSFSGATSVPMMRRDETVTELWSPNYSAALLPYKGGRFSAVILLPTQQLTDAAFADFFKSGSWEQALGYLHQAVGPSLGGSCKMAGQVDVQVICDGTLVMPKFKLDYGQDLTKILGEMGIGGPVPDICPGCFISDIVQKTYVEVDEKGTTAAAATGVGVILSARIAMTVDHPFALGLIDNATDAPLFLGVIGQLG